MAGLLLAAAVAPAASAYTRPEVAALQVALRSAGLYSGTVDGLAGPGTTAAVRAVQQRAGLPADGVAGPSTRRALGRLGQPGYGSRPIVPGAIGWDVAALQFSLAAHGFPSGPVDGGFGPRSAAALQRFQQWAGMSPDGVAGPATLRALSAPAAASPVKLRPPVQAPVGDRFGPRFNVFHAGLDFPASAGSPVSAAGFGTVVTAGFDASGWGNMVVIGHRFGLRTLYAHLAKIAVSPGQSVGVGQLIGTVGSTGRSTGPHLHFELRLRGANIDPLSAL
ncbi:MAG TPA: peptidoglycan-binding protein [Solirubrobacteraceae bacterium]|nr:peptidoglycan-binding protein [Solirubrobacteraceae bacterium]